MNIVYKLFQKVFILALFDFIMASKKKVDEIFAHLAKKDKVLFLTTSNRWEGDSELPKSSLFAKKLAERIGLNKVKIIDVSKLKIYPCEGNISTRRGNCCGEKNYRHSLPVLLKPSHLR